MMQNNSTQKFFALCAIISILAHFFVPIQYILPVFLSIVGMFFMFIGYVMRWWERAVTQSIKALKEVDNEVLKSLSKEQQKGIRFLTRGPYQLSRNPKHLGAAIFLLGLAFFMGSIGSFFGFILYILLINFSVIPKEEKYMEKVYGNRYKEYKKKVRRWVK